MDLRGLEDQKSLAQTQKQAEKSKKPEGQMKTQSILKILKLP